MTTKRKNKVIEISVGIPAHNEEKNIAKLIGSVLDQEGDNFIINEILVHSDNCNDSTVQIVSKISKKYPIVKQIISAQRVGKSEGVNRLRNIANGDLYISFDADISLANKSVLFNIAQAYLNNPEVDLMGLNDIPHKGNNLFQKIIVWRINYWLSTCRSINGGDTVHNHPGRANVTSKRFYKCFKLPLEILADDDYQYFYNKRKGGKFIFIENSIVYYKAPNSSKDFIKQFTRFQDTEKVIESEFGPLAINGYKVPTIYKIKGLVRMFFLNPLLTTEMLFTQLYLITYTKIFNTHISEKWWDTVKSTK